MDLQKRISAWQKATFGDHDSTYGIDNHLIREFKEMLEAESTAHQAEEMADIVILLLGRAEHLGIDLISEVERKFAINQTRTWNKPDAHGVIEHNR